MSDLLNSIVSRLGSSHGTEIVFSVLAGTAVFLFSLGVLSVATALLDPARRRLERLQRTEQQAASTASRLLGRLGPLAAFLLPGREAERSRVGQLLTHAGIRATYGLQVFYGVKALLVATLPLAVLAASPLLPGFTTGMLLFLVGAAGAAGWLLPSIWLDRRVMKRQRALRIGFPDALDLLVVCVESGLGLAPALQRVAEEITVSHPLLGAELGLVNAEMRAGVERATALKNLSERTGLLDIRGLVALLVQTMRFGTSIADALRVYADDFRDRRIQAAEEQAAKIGTEMIFPLVLCLFPAFFLVVVGPAVVRLMDVFSQLKH